MSVWPPGPISALGANLLADGRDPRISYIGHEGSIFYLSGPMAPVLGAQNGMGLISMQGLHPPFTHLDNQGARQDGTTWTDSVYEAGEIDLVVESSGLSAQDSRQVISSWIGAWDPKKLGKLSWFTPERGEWWADVRMGKTFSDQFTQSYSRGGRQRFTWTARNDDAFWKSTDSVSTFQGSNNSGYVTLANIGDQPGWPRYLCYGPGTFTFSDGPDTSRVISFGPLATNQIVLLTTLPRLRSVIDLSVLPSPTQTLTLFQELLAGLISFATINNVPPLLQQFESLFGILPPQGVLYSLLDGRFTTPLPAKIEGVNPETNYIPVSISGGDGNSKIVAALTPFRRWPE
jgi:hypothetical protein